MPPIKLKVELQDMPHKVIRKLLVPEDINMHQLHLVIQDAMGWEHAHLFQFSDKQWTGQYRAGIPDDFSMDSGSTLKEAYKVSLKETYLQLNNGKPFWYTYDFGDSWMHKISFQKANKKQLEAFESQPICVEAIGKCPPEDIGGSWGYAEFLEIIDDESHPEREEMMEWYGIYPSAEYDEMETDIETINCFLSDVFESEEWNTKKYDVF